MSLWRQITHGVRVLTKRDAADRDIHDEVQHYLDEATADFVAQGLSPEQARRAARLEVGFTLVVRDQVRSAGWEHAVAMVAADVRYGLRRLRRDVGFSVVAVLTLGLGIGATTAIFSAVNPILLNPLPYPHASRVVAISDQGNDASLVDVTFGSFREILARSRSFETLAVMRAWQPTIVGGNQPERLEGQRVSADYFRVLGVEPLVGRGFEPADDRPNGPNVVILGDGAWRRRFAADPGIVGQAITLDDASFTVIGVMPSGFENVTAPSAELWAPLQYDASLPTDGREWGHHLRMIGRLRPDVDLDRARLELRAIAENPLPDFTRVPWAALENGLLAISLQDRVTRDVKPALVAVLGAVLLLLGIACVNVMSLQLARGAERRGEFAMRAALGAGRGRLVQQLVTESLLLAIAGGALGLFVADLGIRALLVLGPAELPRVDAIRVDAVAFGFAFAMAAAVGLVTGLVPAVYALREDLIAGLHHGSRRIARRHQATRRALVVAEIGLAIVLLVGAGLLLRSLSRLFSIAPGFDPSHVVMMQVQTAGRRFAEQEDTRRFFANALEAVRRVPGVETAGFASQLPLSGSQDMYGVRLGSTPTGQADADGGAFRYAVTPGYLEAMGISIRRGRGFDTHDAREAPGVVLISESLARSRSPGRDVIGQWVRIGASDAPWRQVVGVVGNVRQESLALDDSDAVYVPDVQWTEYNERAMWLVVRAHGDAGALMAAIKNAVWSIDKDQPIVRASTMDALVARSAGERRFAFLIFEAFALAALALAAVGIYGVLSGSVTERTREIGVRAALGASRNEILSLVIRQGMTLTALGVAVGLGGAAAASRALVTLLFGVSRLDPITYAAVVALLCVVSALACGLPAWRAVKVDPAITLRTE